MIQDIIVIAYKGFNNLKGKKRGRHKDLAYKIDLNKAYDRVKWDFLIATMKKMRFNQNWVEVNFLVH